MAVSSPPLSVEKLTKRFGEGEAIVTALDGVDLDIATGEFVAVMGASGSGKSTLLHLMAGLTAPDEGRVLVDGSDLAGMSDRELTLFRRDKIGLVFQAFNLIPSLTAEENILLPIRAGGQTVDGTSRIDALLALLDITHRRNHRPEALSGGEQQRVAIARALITNPAIVLADEPTGNLDSSNGQAICQMLRELSSVQACTIVMVTHDPGVAAWADRVVIMQDGRVQREFDSTEFKSRQGLATRYHELTASQSQEVTYEGI